MKHIYLLLFLILFSEVKYTNADCANPTTSEVTYTETATGTTRTYDEMVADNTWVGLTSGNWNFPTVYSTAVNDALDMTPGDTVNGWTVANDACGGGGSAPDYYISPDPEIAPTDDELWFTADVACGVGNFVTLTGTDADWSCKSCNGDGSNTGKELFLTEYTFIRETGTGKLHGKCCINGHHRVCQQLLEYYKFNCDDTDKGHVPNRVCT
jgi:hypothetical protein